jgi:predicted cupin superfamily sugar epimerase
MCNGAEMHKEQTKTNIYFLLEVEDFTAFGNITSTVDRNQCVEQLLHSSSGNPTRLHAVTARRSQSEIRQNIVGFM